MKTFEILALVGKISQNKDTVLKTLLGKFFSHFPEWNNEEKKKVLDAAFKAFDETLAELK